MKEKILIVAKTYPNLSSKYDETVCVAGLKENGEWIRIFPIRYRKLPYSQQFRKFDIIEADIDKINDKYIRKESHKVKDETIKIIGGLSVSTDKLSKKEALDNWKKRREIMLKSINSSIEELENERDINNKSIGIIKPFKILDFYKKKIEDCRDWEKDLINGTQKTLFGDYKSPLDKIPYWIGYNFICNGKNCKGHDMMCEDWETMQLFRRMREKYNDDEVAFSKVKEKYLEWIKDRDLYFVVGTESRWNKFLIISLFYPPK